MTPPKRPASLTVPRYTPHAANPRALRCRSPAPRATPADARRRLLYKGHTGSAATTKSAMPQMRHSQGASAKNTTASPPTTRAPSPGRLQAEGPGRRKSERGRKKSAGRCALRTTDAGTDAPPPRATPCTKSPCLPMRRPSRLLRCVTSAVARSPHARPAPRGRRAARSRSSGGERSQRFGVLPGRRNGRHTTATTCVHAGAIAALTTPTTTTTVAAASAAASLLMDPRMARTVRGRFRDARWRSRWHPHTHTHTLRSRVLSASPSAPPTGAERDAAERCAPLARCPRRVSRVG